MGKGNFKKSEVNVFLWSNFYFQCCGNHPSNGDKNNRFALFYLGVKS